MQVLDELFFDKKHLSSVFSIIFHIRKVLVLVILLKVSFIKIYEIGNIVMICPTMFTSAKFG